MKERHSIINRIRLIVFLALGTATTSASAQESYRYQTREDIQQILDSAGVQGAVLIFDAGGNTFYSNDFDWCEKGFLPASTFKIANTIIALETGDKVYFFATNINPGIEFNQELFLVIRKEITMKAFRNLEIF